MCFFSTDINDNAPEFVRKLHEITVEENTDIGTEVLRVMATSRDIGINAEISYSLQHTTREKYLHIHPKTGIALLKKFFMTLNSINKPIFCAWS